MPIEIASMAWGAAGPRAMRSCCATTWPRCEAASWPISRYRGTTRSSRPAPVVAGEGAGERRRLPGELRQRGDMEYRRLHTKRGRQSQADSRFHRHACSASGACTVVWDAADRRTRGDRAGRFAMALPRRHVGRRHPSEFRGCGSRCAYGEGGAAQTDRTLNSAIRVSWLAMTEDRASAVLLHGLVPIGDSPSAG